MSATQKSYAMPYRKPGAVFISFKILKWAVAVVILSIIAYGVNKKIYGNPLKRGNAALIKAFSARRLIEPRLSGGFKAAPFDPARGSEDGIDSNELNLAYELIQDAVITDDPYAHLAYGRLLLAENAKALDKVSDAHRHLRLAVKSLGDKAEPHNDLGVCLMEREKFEEAIEEFDLALNIDSTMPQALFNRALCYQRLQLTEAARADLNRLADIERNPQWRAEVTKRIDELASSIKKPRAEAETKADLIKALDAGDEEAVEAIVRSYYERVQRYAQTLVTDHLKAAAGNDKEKAERLISRIEKLGEMGARLKADYSLASLSKYLRTLPQGEKQKELDILGKYTEAANKFWAGRYGDALPEFEQLRKIFKQRKNYLYELRAFHTIGRCQHHLNRLTLSIQTLKECLSIAERNAWLFDYIHVLTNLGLSYSRLEKDSTALDCYKESLDFYSHMNDSEAKPRQLIGMAYWHFGNLEKALENLQASTNLFLTVSPDPSELAYNYLNIADIYRLSDKHSLALLFGREALRNCDEAKKNGRVADEAKHNNRAAQACSLIALEQAKLQQFDASEESFNRAFQYRDELEPSQREYTEPLIYIRAGEAAALRGDTAKAIDYYSTAEKLAANIEGNGILHINALRGRAEAEEKAGLSERARADRQNAIGRIEGYLAGLIEREHRVEFQDASQSVFDQMIVLEMSRPGHEAQAFEMSERSRARALLKDISSTIRTSARVARSDSIANKTGDPGSPSLERPLSLDEVRAALPDNLTLMVYSVTDERVYIFLISKTGFKVVTSEMTSAKLARLVSEFVSDIRERNIRARTPIAVLKEKASELYQSLIAPAAEMLPPDTTICIVPDKSLHFLPFQTLCDPSGKYFIESHRLTYAPSASVLIRCIEMDRSKPVTGPELFFGVGNPEFDIEKFPELEDLKEAIGEVEESAKAYNLSLVRWGPGATEIEVRNILQQCNIAHFAGHCLVREESPWKAALVLAPGPAGDSRSRVRGETNLPRSGSIVSAAKTRKPSQLTALSLDKEGFEDNPNDGLLSLKEIYDLNLPHVRLVVLSACQSGLGQYYRGEGIVSLIHPFIGARVSTVVASLWPVNSEAASSLMVDFHKERDEGRVRSGDALRNAQLRMIEKGEFAHPYYWASFIVVGGNY